MNINSIGFVGSGRVTRVLLQALKKRTQAQQQLVELLQVFNTGMSEVLGFDFTATSAPAASY